MAEDMTRHTEAMAVDPASEPLLADWVSGLSADVLGRVLELLPRDSILAVATTCRAWSRSTRLQLQCMSPLHLGPFQLGAFSGCRELSIPYQRHKGHGLFPVGVPLPSSKLANVRLFPSVLQLSLVGQHLPQGAMQLLATTLPSLRHLDLGKCILADAELAPLAALKQLTALVLEHVQRADGPRSHSTAPGPPAWGSGTLSVLVHMSQLQVLNVNITTDLQELLHASSKVWMRQEAGIPLGPHAAELLAGLPRLTKLALTGQQLNAADVERICTACTGLQELALSWMCNERSLGLDAAALCHLAQLPALTTLELHCHGGGARDPLSLAPLTGLVALTVVGCNSQHLGLSVAQLTKLSKLVWRESLELITVDLLVQVARSLPSLAHLELSGMRFRSTFRFPADYLFGQLADACPFLQHLVNDDLPLHGTGFAQHAEVWGNVERLGMLRELAVNGSQLLRSSLAHLSSLTALQSLTLTEVQAAEFSHCCRLGCYLRLSHLQQLTALRILAPRAASLPYMDAGAGNFMGPGGGVGGAVEAPLREPHLHFLSTMTSLRHLELRTLHSKGPCLTSLATLTGLRSLALGGRLPLSKQGLAALACCRLPQLEALSITGLGPGVRAHASSAGGAAAAAAAAAGEGGGMARTSAGGAGAPGSSQDMAPLDDVLCVIGQSFTGLEVLEVGSCFDMSAGGLAAMAGCLGRLRYLRLHEQLLGWKDVRRALSGAREVRYVEAGRQGFGREWETPPLVFLLVLGEHGLELCAPC